MWYFPGATSRAHSPRPRPPPRESRGLSVSPRAGEARAGEPANRRTPSAAPRSRSIRSGRGRAQPGLLRYGLPQALPLGPVSGTIRRPSSWSTGARPRRGPPQLLPPDPPGYGRPLPTGDPRGTVQGLPRGPRRKAPWRRQKRKESIPRMDPGPGQDARSLRSRSRREAVDRPTGSIPVQADRRRRPSRPGSPAR